MIDRRPFATSRADDVRLNLVQMTLALPVNSSPEETSRATAEANKAMAAVHECNDLHIQSRLLKGATSGDLKAIRVGDLASNPQMYQDIPKLPIGGAAGPFRVAEGLQVVAMCGKQRHKRRADARDHLSADFAAKDGSGEPPLYA